MTSQQFSSSSSFDPVLSGFCDERFHNYWFSQDHRRGFYTYPPNLGSVSSQNVDLNYCHIPPRNVPYSSFSGDFCRQLPYANHTVLPNRTPSNPWASVGNGDMYISSSPEYFSRFLNNSVPDCYNVQRSSTLPVPVYSSYSQLDREYRAGCNAGFSYGLNQNPSDIGFINEYSMMADPSQIQHPSYQRPAYPFQHKEIVSDGSDDCFPMSHNYSIDEIMRNTVASSAKLTSENRNSLGIQWSLLDNENYIQQPTFSCHSPSKEQYAPVWNFDTNRRADMFSKSTVVDYYAANKPEAVSRQTLAEISSLLSTGTGQTLTDFEVNGDGGGSRQADCKFSTSCAMISSANCSQMMNHVNTISTSACEFVCQSVPELPEPIEEPVIFTPTASMCDRHSSGIESTCCGGVPSECFVGMSNAVVGNTGVCEIPVDEVEQTGVTEGELRASCAESGDGIITVGTSVPSNAMHFESWQSQSDTSEETHLVSAISSAPVTTSETNVASKYAAGSREPMPEVTETTESHTVICDSDDTVSYASDDVIVLSPSPIADEPNVPVSMNSGTSTVKSCCRMQPTCILGNPTTDGLQLRSDLHPVVPKSLPVSLSCVGSHTVGVPDCRSLPSVPLASLDFTQFRNCDVLPSRAKSIVDHNCSVQTTSCQRHLSRYTISCISAASHQPSADHPTCGYVKPTFCHPPVTAVPGSVQLEEEHSYSADLKRLLYMSKSSQKDESKPRTFNMTVGGNSQRIMLENSQQRPLFQQRPMFLSLASSQSFPQHDIAQHNTQKCEVSANSFSRNVCSASLSRLPHISAAVRTNIKQNQGTYYKSSSLPVFRRNSSAMQLRGVTSRSNRTYSLRAATVLLRQLKQMKLLGYTPTHLSHRQLFSGRLSLLAQNREVIDLTGDDDGEEDTVETCERIFARTRRHRVATVPLLHRLRLNYCIRSSYANGCYYDPKHQSTKKTFAVDRSLPFYRCFVQTLLRNYRFTSSGLPVKIYPARPSFSFGNRDVCKAANSRTYKELVEKKQPVVALKRLDQSLLNKTGTVNIETLQLGVRAVAASHRSEAENCVRVTRANADRVQKFTADECTEKETNQEENVLVKLTANGRRHDELISLCHPVSVVLERLDRIKIQQLCEELRKPKSCCQDNQQSTQLGTETNVSNLDWTVIRVPRPNKVPILVIRASTLSTQNTSQNKVADKTSECPTRQMKSALKCLRTRSCTDGIRHLRSLAPATSEFNASKKRTWKKMSGCRKLRFQSSGFMSLRSGNRFDHILRCRHSAPVRRPPYRVSSKCSQKQSKSLSRSLSERSEHVRKIDSKLTERLHASESLVTGTSVEQDAQLLASDSNPKNTLLADLQPYDSLLNQDSPANSVSSDSDTVELSPYDSMDVTAVDQDLCLVPSASVPQNVFSADLLQRDSVFSDSLPEDYAAHNTIELSPHSVTDVNFYVNQDVRSVPSDLVPKNVLSTDLLPCNTVFGVDVPEDCGSSSSSTIDFSRHSSMDDLTIVYRSPLSDVGFNFDEPLLDQQEKIEGSLEAGNCSRKSDIYNDEGLKPLSYLDCDRVTVQPYPATASGSMRFSMVESSTSSGLLSCGLVAGDAENSGKLQITPLQLVDSANDGLEKQHSVNNSPSEFLDRDQKKCEMAALSPLKLS